MGSTTTLLHSESPLLSSTWPKIANDGKSLRRFHFFPKPRGRPKGDARPRRAGSAGGNEPSIAVLKKYWLRNVQVRNRFSDADAALGDAAGSVDGASDEDDEDDQEVEPQVKHELHHDHHHQQQLAGAEQERQRLLRWGLGEGAAGLRGDMEAPFAPFFNMRESGRESDRRARRYYPES